MQKIKKMKKILLLFISVFLITSFSFSQKYEIKLNIKGISDTVVYLCHHFGKQKYIVDTAAIDSKGNATFTKNKVLPKGIYLIVMPSQGMRYFEFLIADSQKITIETDTIDYDNNMVIKGSKENLSFLKYKRKMVELSKKRSLLNSEYEAATKEKNTEKQEEVRQKIMDWSDEMKNYQLSLINENPNYFFSKVLKSMIEPEIPEAPKDENGNIIDETFAYHYFKKHYWDNIDFGESGLLRTPIFETKLDYFIERMIPPIPDSLIVDINKIIRKSYESGDTLMFKYTCSHIFNMFDTSRIMGYDAVMVAIAEEWYLSGKADWVDSTFLKKAAERVEKITPNKIGSIAYNLQRMQSADEKYYTLHDISANYTILIFYEPSCGHCKKEVPKLRDLLLDSLKNMGVKVFAVYTQYDKKEWTDFIQKDSLEIEGWYNVWDGPYPHSKFRDYYDIYSTPAVFILDKDKKIIAKRLAVDSIKGFIEKHEEFLKSKKENKTK